MVPKYPDREGLTALAITPRQRHCEAQSDEAIPLRAPEMGIINLNQTASEADRTR